MMNSISDIMNPGDAFGLGGMHRSASPGDPPQSFARELDAQHKPDEARESAEQLIGIALFMPLLKEIQDNPFKSELMHGGRGEDVFAERLHAQLADGLGRRMGGDLVDAVVKRMQSMERHNRG